jgi:hypothetical protein
MSSQTYIRGEAATERQVSGLAKSLALPTRPANQSEVLIVLERLRSLIAADLLQANAPTGTRELEGTVLTYDSIVKGDDRVAVSVDCYAKFREHPKLHHLPLVSHRLRIYIVDRLLPLLELNTIGPGSYRRNSLYANWLLRQPKLEEALARAQAYEEERMAQVMSASLRYDGLEWDYV